MPYSSLKNLNQSLIHFIKGMSSHFGQSFNQLKSVSNSLALSGFHLEALKLVINSQINITGKAKYANNFFVMILIQKNKKKEPTNELFFLYENLTYSAPSTPAAAAAETQDFHSEEFLRYSTAVSSMSPSDSSS